MKTKIIRKKTNKFVMFISKPFVLLKIPPNVISVFAIFAVIAFYPLLENHYFILAALMIVLNGILDVIDGGVARATKKTSSFGKFLDRTIDKLSEAAILAAFMIYGYVGTTLGLYTIIVMFLATNVSANIEGVLNFKISDAVSLKLFRTIILVAFTVFMMFKVMFIILAIISTYALLYRFIIATMMYFKKK